MPHLVLTLTWSNAQFALQVELVESFSQGSLGTSKTFGFMWSLGDRNAQLGAQCLKAIVFGPRARSSRGGTGGPEGIKEGGQAAEENEERKG